MESHGVLKTFLEIMFYSLPFYTCLIQLFPEGCCDIPQTWNMYDLSTVQVTVDFITVQRFLKFRDHLTVRLLNGEDSAEEQKILDAARLIADVEESICSIELIGLELDGDEFLIEICWDCGSERKLQHAEHSDSLCLLHFPDLGKCETPNPEKQLEWSLYKGSEFFATSEGGATKVRAAFRTDHFCYWTFACCKVNFACYVVKNEINDFNVHCILFTGNEIPLPRLIPCAGSSVLRIKGFFPSYLKTDYHLIKHGQKFIVQVSYGSHIQLKECFWNHSVLEDGGKWRAKQSAISFSLRAPVHSKDLLLTVRFPDSQFSSDFHQNINLDAADSLKAQDLGRIFFHAQKSREQVQCTKVLESILSLHKYCKCIVCGQSFCTRHSTKLLIHGTEPDICLHCQKVFEEHNERSTVDLSGKSLIFPVFALYDAELRLGEEHDRISQVIRDKSCYHSYELKGALLKPTLKKFNMDIASLKPCIVHIAGHSSPKERDSSSGIYWWGSDETFTDIDIEEFVGTIGSESKTAVNINGGIECVLLNSCSLDGLAEKLSEASVPYVIYWRTTVSDDMCIAFASLFYQNLVLCPRQYGKSFKLACASLDFLQFDLKSNVPCLIWNDSAQIDSHWIGAQGSGLQKGSFNSELVSVDNYDPNSSTTRNWNPGVEAGKLEIRALLSLKFQISPLLNQAQEVENPKEFLDHRGCLKKEHLHHLGVELYVQLWDCEGEVVKKAHKLLKHHLPCARSVQRVKRALSDIKKSVSIRKIDIKCGSSSRAQQSSHQYMVKIMENSCKALENLIRRFQS